MTKIQKGLTEENNTILYLDVFVSVASIRLKFWAEITASMVMCDYATCVHVVIVTIEGGDYRMCNDITSINAVILHYCIVRFFHLSWSSKYSMDLDDHETFDILFNAQMFVLG